MLALSHRLSGHKHVHMRAWKRDSHDERDLVHKIHPNPHKNCVDLIPLSANNVKWCPPVFDQGDIGSCTANSAIAILEYNDNRWGPTPGYTAGSRLFQYYVTRQIERSVSEDAGASIRNAIKATARYGVTEESVWPYVTQKFSEKPPSAAYQEGKRHIVTKYHRIQDGDLLTMRHSLAVGYLIEFGFTVFDYMMSEEMAKTGVLKMPEPNEQDQGGHAVVLVGYDDPKKMFLVRNSWGTDWGCPEFPGYFWMPYEYVGNRELANDFWVIESAVEFK
jgi:C1A family cysteine protease